MNDLLHGRAEIRVGSLCIKISLQYTDYRGIMLTTIAAKMTNKMILNRIQPEIDKHLRPNQNGFRPGRSTTVHILALRTPSSFIMKTPI